MKGYALLLLLTLLLLSGCATADVDVPPAARPTPAILRDAVVFYVRPDGGDATRCTGRVDAPYPGSGVGQPCAWEHPFRALPPDGAPEIQGGDTLLIGAGSYMMGYGAPGADECDAGGAFDCHMAPIPSGPDAAHPTRILGAGWNAGCPDPPELWGTERPWFILNLTGSSHVEVACLEITDHSDCVEFHTGGLLGLTNLSIDSFDGRLISGSPAIDAGTTEGAPFDDVESRPRDARPGIGAYEW